MSCRIAVTRQILLRLCNELKSEIIFSEVLYTLVGEFSPSEYGDILKAG